MTSTETRPETADQKAIRRARKQFEAETREHQMTVLHDDLSDMGRPAPRPKPYRHVRFAKPGTGIWSFDLVTWPGHLAISGDLASFTFCRLHDMFDFFRIHSPDPLTINPSYWGEKIVAGARGTDRGRTRYCEEKFVEQVVSDVECARDDLDDEDFEALKRAVADELLDSPPEYIEDAHQRLADFRWTPDAPVRPEDVRPSRDNYGHFTFADTWEWDLSGWDHHFLLACHAIRWGINQYLTAHPERVIREVA